MIHIGISGPIASGKSTLAETIQNQLECHGIETAIIPFASGIRELADLERSPYAFSKAKKLIRSWSVSEYRAHRAALQLSEAFRKYPSVPGKKNRRLFQYVGTEIGRDILHPDIWIRIVQRRGSGRQVVISPDLRFDNEAAAVDIHIGIDVSGDVEAYQRNIRNVTTEYIFSDHPSERSLTCLPEWRISPGFTCEVVANLLRSIPILNSISKRMFFLTS